MKDKPFDPEFFELVVREVIRRLRDQGLIVQGTVPAAADELNLPERLITRATLHGRLAGIGRVVVSLKAIVTPSVRDELKEQAIELVRR